MTEKCVYCGKFIPYREMQVGGKAKYYFEPASDKGPEINEWECADCVNFVIEKGKLS